LPSEHTPAKRIQSRDNAWYKSLQRLATSSRERRAQGRAILDGPHLIEAWRSGGATADALVASESGYARPEARALFDETPANKRIILTDRLFDAVAQVGTPVGIMAASRMAALLLLEIALLFLRRRALPCGRPGVLDAQGTSGTPH
jgi:hypothetical protein